MALREFKEPSPTEASADAPKPKLNVLYVEDEDLNWEVAELHLRDKYKLTRAANSRDAFAFLAKEKFNAILMDIQLAKSDLNGIEITRILRGKYDQPIPDFARGIVATCPIIFLTAYSARYNRDELVSYGGTDMLVKPVNFVSLASILSRAMLQALMTRAH